MDRISNNDYCQDQCSWGLFKTSFSIAEINNGWVCCFFPQCQRRACKGKLIHINCFDTFLYRSWVFPCLNTSSTLVQWSCLQLFGKLKVATHHCLGTGGASVFNYGNELQWETSNFHSQISCAVVLTLSGHTDCSHLASGLQHFAKICHWFSYYFIILVIILTSGHLKTTPPCPISVFINVKSAFFPPEFFCWPFSTAVCV